MHIEYGNTRVVILFESCVVKFPRIRFVDALLTFWNYVRGKKFGVTGDKYENNLLMTVLAYLLAGFTSNRREYAFSKQHPLPEKVIPSRKLFFWGAVHVQKRGSEIHESDPRWQRFVSLLRERGVRNPDLYNIKNFSEWEGVLYIHDCGWRMTVRMLDEFALKMLDDISDKETQRVLLALAPVRTVH